MSIQIREANPSDAALLAEIGATTFFDTFSPYHEDSDMKAYLKKAYDVSAIEANLINPEIIYHIAFDDGIACGYTKLLLQATHPLIETKSIELEKIYVRKNYLGKDAGSLLMKHAINYTKSSGHTTLFLGVWEENKRAVAFYKKFGFEVFTTRTFQLGSTLCDDFMMKLELNQY